jgi:hypothetical protein
VWQIDVSVRCGQLGHQWTVILATKCCRSSCLQAEGPSRRRSNKQLLLLQGASPHCVHQPCQPCQAICCR